MKSDYTKLVKDFIQKIEHPDLKFILFKDEFNFHMANTSASTLLNIDILINEYINDSKVKNENGDKIILLFGILQGLFVGIDAIYTIGKATGLNKLMINLNQHESLREIKHIRNDVVGHPTYRYYEDNSIGYCTLDLNHIEYSKVKYYVYTYENKKINVEERIVDILNSIDDYYEEIYEILLRTIQYFDLILTKEKVNISYLVAILANKFFEGEVDINLLEEIRVKFSTLFKLKASSNNRAIWRLKLIDYLFKLEEKNEYTDYLTYQEMYKLYSLIYAFEKKLDKKLRYRFIKYKQNEEFKYLISKMKKFKSNILNLNILHDSKHPLYNQTIDFIINEFKDDDKCKQLIGWIAEEVKAKDQSMLYLIGSELKK